MQTRSQNTTSSSSSNTEKKTTHVKDWNSNTHYSNIGGQCGQSCPCCRAFVYKSGIDNDAKFGACTICLSK